MVEWGWCGEKISQDVPPVCNSEYDQLVVRNAM